jgi:hypothetical protein
VKDESTCYWSTRSGDDDQPHRQPPALGANAMLLASCRYSDDRSTTQKAMLHLRCAQQVEAVMKSESAPLSLHWAALEFAGAKNFLIPTTEVDFVW